MHLELSSKDLALLLLSSAKKMGTLRVYGGKGSGNFGHEGRPGERGGSGEGTSGPEKWPEGLTKLSGPKGSNTGGLYKDSSGQKWYVKEYKDERQAASEQISNALYKSVGLGAPDSVLGEDGKYASKWLEDPGQTLGEHGVTKDVADKVLDGFAADVFTMNWDAVGTGHDNVLVSSTGKLTRVDQGGTLLFRAQGALKPEGLLNGLGEWDSLPLQNVYYAKVFKAAGVKNANALGERVAKQIDKIVSTRPSGGWRDFVEKHAPSAPKAFKDRVGKMLESRHDLLVEKAKSLRMKHLGGKGSGNFGHAGRPGERGGSGDEGFSDRLARAKENKHPGSELGTEHRIVSDKEAKKYERDGVYGKEGWYLIGAYGLPEGQTKYAKTTYEPHGKETWSSNKDQLATVSAYIWEDKRPVGDIAAKLEGAIKNSAPTTQDLVSYRGMRVDKETLKSFKEGTVISLKNPSSFTDNEKVAADFASKRGPRSSRGSEGVVLEAYIPKGKNVLFTEAAGKKLMTPLGVGVEHLLSGKEKYVVRSVRPYKKTYKIQVEVL